MWLSVLPHNDQVCGLARVTHEQNDLQGPVTEFGKAKLRSVIHAGPIAMWCRTGGKDGVCAFSWGNVPFCFLNTASVGRI